MMRKYILVTAMMTTAIACMDQPSPAQLNQSQKQSSYIDFSNEKRACKALIENEAQLLKSIVAQEQRGKYSPIFKEVHQCLAKFIVPRDPHYNSIFSLDIPQCYRFLKDETKKYICQIVIKKRSNNNLIKIFQNHENYTDISEASLECGRIIQRNRYVINTYGSYEPYEDRNITPLHYVLIATAQGLLPKNVGKEFCALLLSAGANPNARDDAGNTPMHHAHTPQFVRLLCDYGAKTDIKGEFDMTPLINHICIRNWPVVQCLLHYKPGINKQDDRNNTALHKAARIGNLEIVQLLLDHGADWTLKDEYLECPFQTAEDQATQNLLGDRIVRYLENIMLDNDDDAMQQIFNQIPELAGMIQIDEWYNFFGKHCLDERNTLLPAARFFEQTCIAYKINQEIHQRHLDLLQMQGLD